MLFRSNDRPHQCLDYQTPAELFHLALTGAPEGLNALWHLPGCQVPYLQYQGRAVQIICSARMRKALALRNAGACLCVPLPLDRLLSTTPDFLYGSAMPMAPGPAAIAAVPVLYLMLKPA